MSLLFTTATPAALIASSSPSLTVLPNTQFSRFCNRFTGLNQKSCGGLQMYAPSIKERGKVLVKASSDVEGSIPDGSESSTSEGEVKNVSIENIPLESKIQLKLEQRMRMRLAKKIRLRRKRLVRKRHLRKKGRWPPSKMKKNKNV